ncbi:ABC transporter permease subunit [Bacteroides xylanolyticus]|uniref:ABC transporter permease subunit n=2 Tax=Lacrimispora defluvii TaxID=2719233 RepID=A0ABX1VNY3_9FIRM|nr:ABC transporter permease subunit [Lacrimispora defluvii]
MMNAGILRLKKAGIILFWLLIWQAASLAVHNSIILVGPLDVILALLNQIGLADFWKTIGYSFGKINLGFLSAFAAGILAGTAACRYPLIGDFLSPLMALIKSVPVASFVILALIWAGSENLSVIIGFLVVFPIIYIQTIAGIKSTDHHLLEMADVFQMSEAKRFFYLYRPALLPYLASGCRVALGMSWKSGIAAEVIGVPLHSIGEKLYLSKIYLSTADLFAWTLVIILLSAIFESFFLWLLYLASPGIRQKKKEAG